MADTSLDEILADQGAAIFVLRCAVQALIATHPKPAGAARAFNAMVDNRCARIATSKAMDGPALERIKLQAATLLEQLGALPE